MEPGSAGRCQPAKTLPFQPKPLTFGHGCPWVKLPSSGLPPFPELGRAAVGRDCHGKGRGRSEGALEGLSRAPVALRTVHRAAPRDSVWEEVLTPGHAAQRSPAPSSSLAGNPALPNLPAV